MSNSQTIAERAKEVLERLSIEASEQKEEFKNDQVITYSKNALSNLPHLTISIVTKAMGEMELAGYNFAKKKLGATTQYALTVENINDIYKHRGIETYRDQFEGGFTICISNLKGGVSKSVTSVSVAQALRMDPQLIKYDLRILVIDLDPQGSATMFLNSQVSNGLVNDTASQAILKNVSREDLIKHFIIPSNIPKVDVIPASIDDAFIANDWEALCDEYFPNRNIHSLLKENVINKLKGDYDFIFVDCGPHLDAMLTNSLAAADLLLTPIPPAPVDFNSTMKYVSRIPELTNMIEDSGCPIKTIRNVGFMTKVAKKLSHEVSTSLAKEVFQGDMLDASMPRSEAFERVGETFDTVISCKPSNYKGDKKSLKMAREATERFTSSLFSRINMLRNTNKL